jgi:murein L,D-transpeptidase YafK
MLALIVSLSVAPTAEAIDPPVGCLQTVSQLDVGPDPRLQGTVVVVRKEARRIQLFERGRTFTLDDAPACWRVGLGGQPAGTKEVRGDNRTPEGWYRSSDKPWSNFYGAIAVHYPNSDDAAQGLASGLVDAAQHQAILSALDKDRKPLQSTRLGGEILIHGGGGDSDWTLGCIAMDNADLDMLRASLPADKRIHILILP